MYATEMAVTVLNTNITNRRIGDKKSDKDNIYPPKEVVSPLNGLLSNADLIEASVYICFYKMLNCSSSKRGIVYSLPIYSLSF